MLLDLDKFVQGCYQNDELIQLECCQRIRIDQVIKTGVVPRSVQFLKCNKNDKLQI